MTIFDTIKEYKKDALKSKGGKYMKNDLLEISSKTCALSSDDSKGCTLIEEKKDINIDMPLKDYLNYNCEYYGSSLEGRLKSAQHLLGMKYKLPIIVEESRNMIFFPTSALDSDNCSWIALNNIYKFEEKNSCTEVTFNSGRKMLLDISIESFQNQLLRATQLQLILKSRKEE